MTALTFTSRNANSITISLAAGGGETAFEVEVNRAADFASDESILKTGAAAGSIALNGLPAATRFFIRGRSTNGGVKGVWSNVLLASTDQPSSPAPYTGYSIEAAILVVPEPLDQLACAQADAGSLVTNLVNDDPLSTLRSSAASLSIVIHTAGQPVDTFALLGTLANDDATWRIRGATSQANLTAAPSVDSGTVALRAVAGLADRAHYHAFRRLSALYTHAWWQIDVNHNAAQFFARHLVVGKARQSVNYSRGMTYAPYDLTQFGRTQYGAPSRSDGWRGRAINFGLSWLSEAEYQAKWSDLNQLVGASQPVLVVPNPKGNLFLNDRIGYGVIASSSDENVRDAKWAKTLEINSLY